MKPCVISPKATSPAGYARVQVWRFGRKINYHHVLAWVEANGRLPTAGKFILHSPMPGGHPGNCIEPTHLREGTLAENAADCIADGNHAQLGKTHCPQGHPYDEVNTYRYPAGYRGCRICTRDATRRYRLRIAKESVPC